MSDDQPALVRMGANTRGAPSKINLDVSGTVGPDYLGQETVDVDGHSADRPGVRSRIPEEAPDHYDVSRMDTGEELPVLLSSSMSPDPIEGTQGSYTQIIEGECARCGYDRLVETIHTLPGERRQQCNACDAIQDYRSEDGYRMPQTASDRAQRVRDSGEAVGSVGHLGDVYKASDRRLEAVSDNDAITQLWGDDIVPLVECALDAGMVDPAELLGLFDFDRVGQFRQSALRPDATGLEVFDWIRLVLRLTPEHIGIRGRGQRVLLVGSESGRERDRQLCEYLFE